MPRTSGTRQGTGSGQGPSLYGTASVPFVRKPPRAFTAADIERHDQRTSANIEAKRMRERTKEERAEREMRRIECVARKLQARMEAVENDGAYASLANALTHASKTVATYLVPPTQRNELTGPGGTPLGPQVAVYLPDNGRGHAAETAAGSAGTLPSQPG